MPPPKFVVCYLCGQQFGTSSLGIHQKQCYSKKLKQWSAAHPSDRGPKPTDPAAMQAQVQAQMQATRSVAHSSSARKPVQSQPSCHKCGVPSEPNAKFCQECGTRQRPPKPAQSSCSKCGASHDPKSRFCEECGSQLAPPSASASATPRPSQPSAARAAPPPSGGNLDEMNQAALDMFRVPCKICGRKFDPERVRKHEDVCRTASRKRKTFDSHKARVEGTDMQGNQRTFVREVKKGLPEKKPESKWRAQHREFIQGIRSARQMSDHMAAGGSARDLPPPPPSHNPDYVQCPHCTRRFNAQAAERHIPRCQNTISRPKPPPGSSFGGGGGGGGGGYGRGPKASALPATSSRRTGASRASASSHDYMGGGGGGGGAFGGSGRRTGPPAGFGGGGGGGGGGGSGPDPRSNVQTTSVLGSGLLAHRAKAPSSYQPTGRTSDLPRVQRNAPAVGGGGGGAGVCNERDCPNNHANHTQGGGGRILNSNVSSSAMYAARDFPCTLPHPFLPQVFRDGWRWLVEQCLRWYEISFATERGSSVAESRQHVACARSVQDTPLTPAFFVRETFLVICFLYEPRNYYRCLASYLNCGAFSCVRPCAMKLKIILHLAGPHTTPARQR